MRQMYQMKIGFSIKPSNKIINSIIISSRETTLSITFDLRRKIFLLEFCYPVPCDNFFLCFLPYFFRWKKKIACVDRQLPSIRRSRASERGIKIGRAIDVTSQRHLNSNLKLNKWLRHIQYKTFEQTAICQSCNRGLIITLCRDLDFPIRHANEWKESRSTHPQQQRQQKIEKSLEHKTANPV